MPTTPYLAEVTEPQPAQGSDGCLSVFFSAGDEPPQCLIDPYVVSERPAAGHWQLLGVDVDRRRAYYARIDHSRMSECAGGHDQVSGSSAARADDR